MEHQRMCDYCEKEQLGMVFHLPEDEARFVEYKELPGPFSFHGRTMSLSQGKVFYLPALGIAAVVCNKCLASAGELVVLPSLVSNPRVIKEAIVKNERAIAECQSSLAQKKSILQELQAQKAGLEEEILVLTNDLSMNIRLKERLAQKSIR